MWKRITEQLRSPVSGNPLTAVSFGSVRKEIAEQHLKLADDMGVSRDELSEYIVDGVLLCESDKTWYPIIDGLPVLLPYRTRYRDRFSKKFKQQLTNVLSTYSVPDAAPAKGEKFILTSFSEEWKDYDYDGVIWELDYADQRRRLKAELDLDNHSVQPGGLFLEVGCGLGITTVHAQQLLGLDVFGVDLSLASHRAVKQFEQNPFIHFIQASLFHLPFERETFEVIYSRGVLHHTYSTEAAFKNVATYCKSGGRIYVWVYGDGSIDSSFLRKILYQLEKAVRPRLSKNPSSFFARAFLGLSSIPYVAFNRLRRLGNPEIEKLTIGRAVHAARDRFTPEFAFRHSADEVLR